MTVAELTRINGWASRVYALPAMSRDTVWLDTVAGNDAAHGRLASAPVLTLAKAAAIAGAYAATDIGIVVVAPQATPIREVLVWNSTKSLTIEPLVASTPWFVYASERFTSGWTLAGSVYQRAVTGYSTGCLGVLVSTLADADGNWRRLTENTATPTTPGLGEYGQVIAGGTGTIYVRLPGDANPNGHTIEAAKRDYGLWTRGTGLLTARHGRFYCANVAGVRTGGTGVSDDGNSVVEDCDAWYANVGGFATATGTWTGAAYVRCGAYASNNDGFNGHGGESGGLPTGAQIATMTDCDAAYNRDEGCSFHERTTVTQTGGRMHHNGSGGITHINNVAATISGVEIDHNQRTNLGSDSGGVNFEDTVSGSMTACNVHDNPHEGIRRKATATVVVSGNTSGTAAGNGFADNLVAA